MSETRRFQRNAIEFLLALRRILSPLRQKAPERQRLASHRIRRSAAISARSPSPGVTREPSTYSPKQAAQSVARRLRAGLGLGLNHHGASARTAIARKAKAREANQHHRPRRQLRDCG